MGSVFRWLMRGFLALAALLLVALLLAYYLASQSLPDYNATWRVRGPQAEIEIVRDSHAVPHILSRTDADAFFGLGFVHAQDRLWQMTLARRTAQGRLSEQFGAETLPIDRMMRSLDLYGHAREAVARQTEPTRAALEAYSAGVNAWLDVVRTQALGRGAPEFFLFDQSLAPWIPADSIAIQKLVALQMTDKASQETLRARLSLVLPPERLRDLLPDAPNAPVMGLPDFSATFPGVTPGMAPMRTAARHPLDPIPEVGLAGASNAFAASGKRAAGGAPLLANDPHLGLTAPSAWMLARMDLAEGSVIGATMPGLPSILVGRNEALAWGITTSYLDDQDVYIEKLDPGNPDRYLVQDPATGDSRFEPFDLREVRIGVRGGATETLRLQATHHGPVLPPDRMGVGPVTPPGHVATLAWTGLTDEDRSVGAGIALMRAHSIDEARKAAADIVAPSLNLTLADRTGVAMQMTGAAPKRDPANTSQGRMPAPGWLAVNDWKGMRPFSENPWIVDPPSGIVVNTNNRLTDASFPNHLSFDWGDTFRIARASWLLGAREFHTLDSFIEIQTDIVSEAARTLLPLIARDLWYKDAAAAAGTPEAQRQLALERLANWNGAMSEHAPEPLIYSAWLKALMRRLVVDELGTLATLVPAPDPVFLERVFRDTDGASRWCDIVQTREVEPCAEIARAALDEALLDLGQTYGPQLESWRWGDAHQAQHEHQTLGRVPFLGPLANIRQSTPGDDQTLLRGSMPWTGPEPFLNTHAAGFRGVFDFSDPDASVFIIATGESGHLLSRFYDDLAVLWRRSEYIPMSLDPGLARAGAIGTTRLVPATPEG